MEYEAHPLFLPEDDEDPVAVDEIQISRVEQGQQVFYPRMYPASELTSLEQITAELGGGTYILVARHDKRISTRRKIVLPGKSKPMYDESRTEEKPPVAATPAIDPMTAMMGGQSGGLMPFMMMMMQQMNAAADRQMQLVIAMMQNSRESTTEDKANVRAEMQANLERERIASEKQMTMMREMMMLVQNRGSGSGEEFTRGVEFMRGFATQQIETLRASAKGEDNDWGSLLETLLQVVQGASLLKGMAGGPLPEGAAQAAAEAAAT